MAEHAAGKRPCLEEDGEAGEGNAKRKRAVEGLIETEGMKKGPETLAEEAAGAAAFLHDLPSMTKRRDVLNIVHAMQRHRMHNEVQEAACRALLKLTPCVEPQEWRKVWDERGSALDSLMAEYDELAAHGVIDIVSQAMWTHVESSSVVESGCKVLGCVARCRHNEAKIAEAGGFEAIIEGTCL
jgi:hypothetical protein